MEFKRKYPDTEWDREMHEHFFEFHRKISNGETRENHGDPREFFEKRIYESKDGSKGKRP